MKSLLVLLWFLACSGICQAIGTTKGHRRWNSFGNFPNGGGCSFLLVYFCCTESLMKVDVDGSCKEIMDMIGNLQFLYSY